MKTRVVLLLSIAILIAAVAWLVIQPSPEPVVTALAAMLGVVSQLKEGPRPGSRSSHSERATPDERSLLVMPVANLSSDPENEYFSDGLTEELIVALAHVPSVRVNSRHSAISACTSHPAVGMLRPQSNPKSPGGQGDHLNRR